MTRQAVCDEPVPHHLDQSARLAMGKSLDHHVVDVDGVDRALSDERYRAVVDCLSGARSLERLGHHRLVSDLRKAGVTARDWSL